MKTVNKKLPLTKLSHDNDKRSPEKRIAKEPFQERHAGLHAFDAKIRSFMNELPDSKKQPSDLILAHTEKQSPFSSFMKISGGYTKGGGFIKGGAGN